MTPCEKKGYKVGHVFEVMDNNGRSTTSSRGDVLVLTKDDRSSYPQFILVAGKHKGEYTYPDLPSVKRIHPPEELSDMVDITCEGNTVTISRESAKALKLI